jgi:ankyrin repeat protein
VCNEKLCSLLISSGADVNQCNDDDADAPLIRAGSSGNVNIATGLLKAGALLERCSSKGERPLYLACARGHRAMASLLLERGANPCLEVTATGNTPLHAVAYNSVHHGSEIVPLLVNHGANVNALSLNGFTPLHLASFAGNSVCCELLLQHKADPMIVSTNGSTAYQLASSIDVQQILQPFVGDSTHQPSKMPHAEQRRRGSLPAALPSPHGDLFTFGTPKAQVRVFRERSISSPFLKK